MEVKNVKEPLMLKCLVVFFLEHVSYIDKYVSLLSCLDG